MLRNHLKVTGRNLRNNLSYTIINILGLGLGMAGAVLIFLFVQYHLRVDRHHPAFDRLYRVVLDLNLDEGKEYEPGSSFAMSRALASDYSQVEKVGFMRKIPNATFSANPGSKVRRFLEKDNVVFADQNFMEMFVADGFGKGGAVLMMQPYMVVISEWIAFKYFGTTDVVGQLLKLDNKTELRVAALVKTQTAPTDFDFDIYISLPTLQKMETDYEVGNFGWISSRNATFVQLVDGRDPKSVETQIGKNGRKYYGDIAKYYSHKLQPLVSMHFDEQYDGKIRKEILWLLSGVGLFLIVIACINFVNLATAQALKRANEIGVRKVLGSTRQQLFWRFMYETALLAMLSTIWSVFLVLILVPVVKDWSGVPYLPFTGLDYLRLSFFWIATFAAVVLLGGFYPAVVISGFNPVTALKSRVGPKQAGGVAIRRVLVGIQLMIAHILLIGTLVLILQMQLFRNADLGFDQRAIVILALPPNDSKQHSRESLRDLMMQYPEVTAVTYQYEPPTSAMGYGGSVRFDNRSEWEKFMIRDRFGDQHYLETYRMQLLAGRSISAKEAVTEFVVNEEFMRRVSIRNPQEVLGKQMEDGNTGLKGEIVGVVKSFHLKSLQSAIEPCAIFARPGLYKEIAIKLESTNLSESLRNLQKAWLKIYPDEVFDFRFLDDQVARFYRSEQQLTHLIQAFGLMAVFICCIGLFGMISFMVAQRAKEIGVRKVLGAGVQSIMFLLGREVILLTTGSFFVAVPVALFLVQEWLSHFAYRIALEWWILVSGGISILFVAILTVGLKVVRASLADPVKSLRAD
jgi:putative ABC transport system permease protein